MKACHVLADDVIRHQRDAVVIAARAVVEVFLPAKVGAPVAQKVDILHLHALPDGFALRFRIVVRDLLPNFRLAGL